MAADEREAVRVRYARPRQEPLVRHDLDRISRLAKVTGHDTDLISGRIASLHVVPLIYLSRHLGRVAIIYYDVGDAPVLGMGGAETLVVQVEIAGYLWEHPLI